MDVPFSTVIEVLGLTLAVLDFFGLAPVLERRIEAVRTAFLDRFVPGIATLFGATSGRLILPSIIAMTLLFVAAGIVFNWGDPSSEFLGSLLRLLVILIYAFLLLVVTPLILVMLIFGPVSELLKMMEKAPNGSVGTLGLLLAVSSFLLDWV